MDIYEKFANEMFTRELFEEGMNMLIASMDVLFDGFDSKEYERIKFDLKKIYSEYYEDSVKIYIECLRNHLSEEQVTTMYTFYSTNRWFSEKQKLYLEEYRQKFEKQVAEPVVAKAFAQVNPTDLLRN